MVNTHGEIEQNSDLLPQFTEKKRVNFPERETVENAVLAVLNSQAKEKYAKCIDTSFLDKENRPSLEEIKKMTRELNPFQSEEKLFTARIWDIEKFEGINLPVVVGELEEKKEFSEQQGMRILDLPIKMPGQGWKIPEELEQFKEIIAMSVDQERMLNPKFDEDYFVYIIVDQKIVQPGENQRRAGYHSDAFVTGETEVEIDGEEAARLVDRTYLAFDELATGFLPGPFPIDCDPEDCEEVLASFKRRAEGKTPFLHQPYTVLRLDPYDLHSSRTNETDKAMTRTFVKISFSKSVYNREGNDINPHFQYNWSMVPRDPNKRAHRNHIVGADKIDRDKFTVVDPRNVDFEKDEINWIEKGIFSAKKIEGVRAEPAKPGERLETKVNDFLVTSNVAREGFWKITTSQGDQYFLDGKRFTDNYEAQSDENGVYKSKGVSRKMVKIAKDICFVAPWGAMQYIPKGGVLVISDKYDIYGIHPGNFEASFKKEE